MPETILAILAVYRLARMLAMEEGPFDVFARIRGCIDPMQETWIGRGINCALCVGIYISLVVSLSPALFPWSNWETLVLNWFAIAGGQAALHLWIEK